MTDRELMQQALDALDLVTDLTNHDDEVYAAIEALRARLAQPEPEPVTMVISKTGDSSVTMSWWHEPALPVGTSLYTAPPQREWQGLTDEEVKAAWSQLWYDLGNGKFAASDDPARHTTIMFAKEIEAKLKEKNT